MSAAEEVDKNGQEKELEAVLRDVRNRHNRASAPAAQSGLFWARSGLDTFEGSKGKLIGAVRRGGKSFIGERQIQDGLVTASSGLHLAEDGGESEALVGHVFRRQEDIAYVQSLSAWSGTALRLDGCEPIAVGLFTSTNRQVLRQALGVVQNGFLNGAEVLRYKDGQFGFKPFAPKRVDSEWLMD